MTGLGLKTPHPQILLLHLCCLEKSKDLNPGDVYGRKIETARHMHETSTSASHIQRHNSDKAMLVNTTEFL